MHNTPSALGSAASALEKPPVSAEKPASVCGSRTLLIAVAALLTALLWDFSWESTIGIDLLWSPPHSVIYLAVMMAGATAGALVSRTSIASAEKNSGIKLFALTAPTGAWVSLWGACAFAVATLFDRWWQSNYGLVAGLWHPPQIVKTIAFFALALGAWLLSLAVQNRNAGGKSHLPALCFSLAAGLLLALITFISLTSIYPNRQHSASFYQLACIAYPLVLVATAVAGKLPFSATLASLFYMASISLMVWLLPLFPAKPQVAPIYNALDHLMPPPFPLLLVIPGFAIDGILRFFRARFDPASRWLQAALAGCGFFLVFIATQWVFAEFLLSDLADNWFFAGAGTHWPFFLKIDAAARTTFWDFASDRLTLAGAFADTVLAIASAAAGLLVGNWMKTVQR